MKRTIAIALILATPAIGQEITKDKIVRPAGAKSAPVAGIDLVKRGEALFSEKRLSKNDMSCATCHSNFDGYNETFKQPYPHMVSMPKEMTKLDTVNAETMVQFCLMAPMQAEPLAWDSLDLAALTAYVEKVRVEYAKRK